MKLIILIVVLLVVWVSLTNGVTVTPTVKPTVQPTRPTTNPSVQPTVQPTKKVNHMNSTFAQAPAVPEYMQNAGVDSGFGLLLIAVVFGKSITSTSHRHY
jgi:hypothetical protein